jgi:hypothetical protein
MKVMSELGIDTRSWSYSLLGNKAAKKAAEAPSVIPEDLHGDPHVSSIVSDETEDRGVARELYPVYILDTQLLFAALRCGGSCQKKGLQHICIGLNVNQGVLGAFHNAGECVAIRCCLSAVLMNQTSPFAANDAHYTAAALFEMAKGPHYIAMREIAEKRLAEHEQTSKKAVPNKPKVRSWSAASSAA